jgi:hypothetical protein
MVQDQPRRLRAEVNHIGGFTRQFVYSLSDIIRVNQFDQWRRLPVPVVACLVSAADLSNGVIHVTKPTLKASEFAPKDVLSLIIMDDGIATMRSFSGRSIENSVTMSRKRAPSFEVLLYCVFTWYNLLANVRLYKPNLHLQ